MLLTNSFSFPSFENVLIFSSPRKKFLLDTNFWVDGNHLLAFEKYYPFYLLTSMVFDKKFSINQIVSPLQVRCCKHFSHCFQNVLSYIFRSSSMLYVMCILLGLSCMMFSQLLKSVRLRVLPNLGSFQMLFH